MTKRTLIFVIAFLISGCASKKISEGPVIVTGNLENFEKDEVEFSHREYKLFSSQTTKDVSINPDGSFKMKLKTDAPTKGFFSLGKVPATYQINVTTPSGKDSTFTQGTNDFRIAFLYLQPGDSVHMNVDVEDIAHTLSFSGDHAQNSTFVNAEENRFNSYQDKVINNSYNLMTWGPDEYESIIDKQKKEKLQFLDDYAAKNDISNHLKEVYKWDYIGDAVSSKIYYKSKRERFINKKINMPSDYYNFMDDVPLANDFSNKGIGYFYFLDGYLTKKYELENESDGSRDAYYDFVKKEVEGKPAYEYFAFKLSRDFNRELYNKFDESSPYPDLASRVKENYNHLEGMLAGSPAPEVTLTDMKGNENPLSSLQGQNIYIDFWATWCVPCIEEIPYIDKLKEEYEGKNIQFVSISFDT